MRRPLSNLVPLSALAKNQDRAAQAEARVEDRLRRSWLLVVGSTLVNQTCLLRAHRGTLLVGCWHPDVILNLRASAEATWPQIQARLDRLWKLKFQRMEIVPCDPPQEAVPCAPRVEVDPLKAVLELLREQAKGGWTARKR